MEWNGTRISKLVDNKWNGTEQGYLNKSIMNGITQNKDILTSR